MALTSLGCAASTPPLASTPPSGSAALYRPEALPGLSGCGTLPTAIGRVQSHELNEISGVVESRSTPGVLFVHNDSGDSPRFFALDATGILLAELSLENVPILIDAEDIANGPGPGGSTYLYLGDTGNNFASMGLGIPRLKAVLYRMPEPLISRAARGVKVKVYDTFPIVLTFPDGARDVEAFFVDPRTGDLYMVSKQHDGHSQVLEASAATLNAGGGKLSLLGTLQFGSATLPGSTMPTSASISRDGGVILIRTYDSIFEFKRGPGESVWSALGRAPLRLPSPSERQGEAIGLAGGDTDLVTISEGIEPAIHCLKLPR